MTTIDRYASSLPANDLLKDISTLRRLMGFWERYELEREVRSRLFYSSLHAVLRRLELAYYAELIDFAEQISLKRAAAAYEAMVNSDNPLIARVYEHHLMQWMQLVDRVLDTCN